MKLVIFLLFSLTQATILEDLGIKSKPSVQQQQDPIDKTLKFNENHEFVILQLTDLHYGASDQINAFSTSIQETLIQTVRPDLIVVTGDAVSGYDWNGKSKDYFKSRWQQFTQPYLKFQTKYAYIFGNHEAEADFNAAQIGELDKTHPYSVFAGNESGDTEGYSNYVLNIGSAFEELKDKPSFLLWMFDTRKTGCDGYDKTYGCINKAQLEWYRKQSESLQYEDGSKVQGLGFFHIPIPEFMNVWNYHLTYGTKAEKVCCPTVNSGAFDQFRKTGNIKGLFCGHDHVNDYGGTYHGIELVYGRKSGVGSYGPNGLRGGRVIKLKESMEKDGKAPTVSFESYIVLEDRTIVKNEEPHWQGYEYFQTKCAATILQVLGLFLMLNLF